MVEILRDFPSIHQTFNLVPSLMEQLMDYAEGHALDRSLRLTLKDRLTAEDKQYMLSFFFSLDWDKVIRRYPRYWQLLQLRSQANGDINLFAAHYWRDLATWFNLAWIDPSLINRDETLRLLAQKGSNFSADDVMAIVEKHREICSKVLPTYRAMQESGQIEVSTSPYFHPILPLLIDSRSARMASPGLNLPDVLFAYPEDAAEQIRRALTLYSQVFERSPRGLWPPEGAVSQETISMVASRDGLIWLTSDEGILARSLGMTSFERDGYGHVLKPRLLYQPYSLQDGKPNIIFRDHLLSDQIGFVYKHWDSRKAAEDLVQRLHRIRENLADETHPYLVSIILDGENCWEGYDNNGDDFLRHLYQLLSADDTLQTVTLSEYLSLFPSQQRLDRLFAGSWIGGHLETWIGEPAQNKAWELLAETRLRLIAWQQEYPLADFATLERAWNEIYISEGSDWFWWYYSHNKQGHEQLFDVEFRSHLANVYYIMGLPVPSRLKEPISRPSAERFKPISAYITPRLSAEEDASLEWTGAGYLEPVVSTGTMLRAAPLLKRLYFGYNPADLFLRLEVNEPLSPYFVGIYLSTPSPVQANERVRYADSYTGVEFQAMPFCWEVALMPGSRQLSLDRAMGQEVWRLVRPIITAVIGKQNIELSIPLADLGLRLEDTVSIVTTVAKNEVLLEILPLGEYLSFTLADFL